MRGVLALFLLPTPALGWDFAATPVCTLSHETAELTLSVTYDPSLPEPYAIDLTLADGATWPAGPVFAIAFDGAWPLTIRTDRHRLSEDGRTLTVTDTGFGNVLDGIGRNRTATALLGGLAVAVPLDGAGPALAAFRDCPLPATA
jgi:hypothetical protein